MRGFFNTHAKLAYVVGATADPLGEIEMTINQETLKRMIAQAVEAEREACAKVCESYLSENPHSWGGTTMAAAIRARGLPPTQGGNE